MWQLYHATARELIAQREAEAEAIRIERLVSRGIYPASARPARFGRARRLAAAAAVVVSRRAADLAGSLDARVAERDAP